MPLQTPYGVVSGVVDHYDLQNPSGGQWPHYHIYLNTPVGLFDSAINLKSLTNIQIEYRTRAITPQLVASILGLPDGWMVLAQTSSSGALDYVRHPGLTGSTGWTLQTGDNLISEMQYLLTQGVQRLHIFGAHYLNGLGVHDVHMNQGDPPGTPFALLDGVWQDGGLLFEYTTSVTALQIKFETQSWCTGAQGEQEPCFRLPYVPPMYIPRWKWPPGDPMTDEERGVLVEHGLFEMIRWAGAVHYVTGQARKALARELQRQLAELLPDASAEHLELVGAYVTHMGVELG